MYSTRSRTRIKLTPQRIGIILIFLSLVWGIYLMKIQLDERSSRPEYLKARIIELSKEYIQALARAKNLDSIDGQVPNHLTDLKTTTALLLENMMKRIDSLEKQVESVIVNSTLDFENLEKKIQSLNYSRHINSNKTRGTNQCIVPNNPDYPECSNKVKWLQAHWITEPKYTKHGVNGSLCTIIRYLSEVESWCPPKVKPALNCKIPQDSAFPDCFAKVQWMRKFWKSNPKYQGSGVDGSDCSILFYLSEIESFCPLIPGRKFKSDCQVPNSLSHQSCMSKVAWMRNFWKSDPCYAQDHGVNGTICSFLVYLSEVENWCPLLPGRSKPTEEFRPGLKSKPDLDRENVEKLLALLNDNNPIKFKWIKTRIRQMWPDWIDAKNRLKKSNISESAVQKKILIHIGVLANEATLHFAANAAKGGPLGELVQWSDLIVSLYLLGHDIVVTADILGLRRALGRAGVKGRAVKACPTRIPNDFDLIYLDYYGVRQMMRRIGNLMPHFKCKFRILDSFGTEAQFNYAGYTEKIPGGSMGIWGRHNLNLLQFMTMFPHSPDNSFLGFVVGKQTDVSAPLKKRKPRALIYGKHYSIWMDFKNRKFLDTINKYLEIHATVGGMPKEKLGKYIPEYVINHGVISAVEVQELLQNTLVFVGLGFPYEGPAPLEAIANGCFFLNPKYEPPRNRLNTKFFKDKPTLRKITSQHPYAEEYIAKPYVYTVDIDKTSEVDAIMQKIVLSKPVKPYLPFEFTHEGMLERLHKFIQNQDFCGNVDWPPRNVVKPTVGKLSKSCKETCHVNGMVCEPHLFREINTSVKMTRAGFPCNTTKSAVTPSLVAPGYRTDPPACLIQAQSLLYSCTASSPTTKRLCPCREFKQGQVALCKTC